MAHKKAGGSTRLGRDSNPQYLGVKLTHGQFAKKGQVITRQRGTKIHPGKNVRRGKDDTLYGLVDGIVHFTTKMRRRFDGTLRKAKYASVIPVEKK